MLFPLRLRITKFFGCVNNSAKIHLKIVLRYEIICMGKLMLSYKLTISDFAKILLNGGIDLENLELAISTAELVISYSYP